MSHDRDVRRALTPLQTAFHTRAIDRADLAIRVGRSADTVGQWVSDEPPNLRSANLERLATALDFSVPFLASARPLPVVSIPFFRSQKALSTQKFVERARALGTLAYLALADVESGVRQPSRSLASLERRNGESPEIAARRLRRHLRLNDKPIQDIFSVAWDLGIVALFGPTDLGRRLDSFVLWADDIAVLIVDPSMANPFRCRFDVAHEIGHLVLHDGRPPKGHKIEEVEADVFASEFLYPTSEATYHVLRQALEHVDHWQRLIRIKQVFGISLSALIKRGGRAGLGDARAWETAYSTREFWAKGELADVWDEEFQSVLSRAWDTVATDLFDASLSDLPADVSALLYGRDGFRHGIALGLTPSEQFRQLEFDIWGEAQRTLGVGA